VSATVTLSQRLGSAINLLAVLSVTLGCAMLPSLACSYIDQSPDLMGFSVSVVLLISMGSLFYLVTRRGAKGIHIGAREGFLLVAIGWLASGLIGALPFYLYPHLAPVSLCTDLTLMGTNSPPLVGADFCSFTHAAFESISGFTTTGATIITDGLWGEPGLTPDGRVGLPRGILLWRAATQYLGGMGLIVLGVAVFPLLGVGGMQLFRAEVPGPETDKLAPRIGETAKLLWRVYLLLSAVMFCLLLVGGVSIFESICHTFTTMATAGFSTRAESIAGFNSAYVEWVIIVFMVIAGTNFALHFAAIRGRFKLYGKDPEWWAYIITIFVATILVSTAIFGMPGTTSVEGAVRTGAFQVVSIMTTTGYASTDYEQWNHLALLGLMGLMFVGGMAGSTSGGFKVVRHLLIFRTWTRELFYLVHPRGIRPIRLAHRVVPPPVIRAVTAFAGAYFTILALGTIFFVIDGQDLLTAFTCSTSSLGNIGPGLGAIGPYDNYAGLSMSAKWVSAFLMLLGRLELFTLLVLFSPSFWRR